MHDRWSTTIKSEKYTDHLMEVNDSGKKLSSSQLLRWGILNDMAGDEFVTVDNLKSLAKSYYPIHSEEEFWNEFSWLFRQGYIGPYEEVHSESTLTKNQIMSLPELKVTQLDRLFKFWGTDGHSKQGLDPEVREMEYHPEEMTDEEMN